MHQTCINLLTNHTDHCNSETMNKNSYPYWKTRITKKESYTNWICTGGADSYVHRFVGRGCSQSVVVDCCVDSDKKPLFYQKQLLSGFINRTPTTSVVCLAKPQRYDLLKKALGLILSIFSGRRLTSELWKNKRVASVDGHRNVVDEDGATLRLDP